MLHTDTRIYRKSLDLIRNCSRVIDGLPRGHAHLADQLRRAASSITLNSQCAQGAHQNGERSSHLTSLREAENFAEGAGKRSAQDRLRFFHCARGSANEVVAILDVALAFRAVEASLHDEVVELADHLAAMLSRFH